MAEKSASDAPEAGRPALATSETQTSNDAGAPTPPQLLAQRLVAPLQTRDPDRYDVLGEHGRGGLGKVARALDKELGRNVAIKELIKRGDIGEIRFLREAMITARLEHPGIVPIHEAGRWPDGTPFYVMKLVAGRSLKELLDERRTVEQRIALLHHVVAVADAVAYAHQRKIIHRDLKPGNVIVGDFGETVVIDWGLAKDLSEPDEPALEPGVYSAVALTDLTEAGTVLGTPTYMPPEQFRGEAVDERADVFAIGAMLWELCSTSKVPPADPRHRDRLLRKAGIDNDLGAIIAKALSPEPARRYPDAGALAADLKAFTSGARIASRRYSVIGVIRHWARRHRALAITITAALLLVTIGAIASMVNITAARDHAEAEQHRAERVAADLTLENAELLLTRDPTAVVDALASYHGSDMLRRQRLLAEARGRGVAEAVLQPNSGMVVFLAGDESGAIVSAGTDDRLVVTRNNVSAVLESTFSWPNTAFRHSPQRRLLAYITKTRGVALLDLKTWSTSSIDVEEALDIDLSPDGTRLAITNARNELIVWALTPKVEIIHRRARAGRPPPTGGQLKPLNSRFAGSNRLLTLDERGLRSISFDGRPDAVSPRRPLRFDARDDGLTVAAYDDGAVALLSRDMASIAQASICKDKLVGIEFVPRKDAIVVACQDGLVAILRFGQDEKSFSVDKAFTTSAPIDDVLSVDHEGRWVFVGDMSNTVYAYDLATRLITRYEGHGSTASSAKAPTPGFQRVLVGDYSGAVRVWRPPTNDARILYRAPANIQTLAISHDDQDVVVGGQDIVVRSIRLADGHMTELGNHSDWIFSARATAAGVLTSGLDGTVRTWNKKLLRVFTGHGTGKQVYGVDIHPNGQAISAGNDGRLFSWSLDGNDQTLLFKHSKPLFAIAVLQGSGNLVVADDEGAVWEVTLQGSAKMFRPPDGRRALLEVSKDGRRLAVGTVDGDIIVYDTASWAVLQTARMGEPIMRITFDPQVRDLVIVLYRGGVRAIPLDTRRVLTWSAFPIRARWAVYHPSGDIIAFPCSDGTVWFHSVADGAWIYTRSHEGEVLTGEFTHDGRSFVSADYRGVVIVRDVAATLASAKQRSLEQAR